MAGGTRGLGLLIVLIGSVIGVVVALAGSARPPSDGGPMGVTRLPPTPTPAPQRTPVATPAPVLVGSQLDPGSGRVEDEQFHFESGATVAFSAWLGEPVGAENGVVSLLRLTPEGFRIVGQRRQVRADPDMPYLAAELSADQLIEEFGPGTYALEVTVAGVRIGFGVFQLESDMPQAIQLFAPRWRPVAIAAGGHVGVRFDDAGTVIAEKPGSVASDSSAPASHRATFNGRDYVFVMQGIWANYYLPESDAVRVEDGASGESGSESPR